VQVLLADDHGIVRRGVRRLLEVAGMTVVAEAADGFDAIHRCIHHRPDVIVLDLGMPKLNGFEVIALLRSVDDQPAIVVLSAHEDVSYVLRAVEMGVRAYVLKTSTDEDLIPAIHAAAGGRSFFSAGLRLTASARPEIACSKLTLPQQER
jgi:DNA-binding NarL/FixJ family response regulator